MTELLAGEFYFQWHITEKCNLRCKHCYHDSYTSSNELTSDQLTLAFEEMAKALAKWKKNGSASLTGGEPFLRKADLFRVAQMMDQSDQFAYYDILTNGSLIDPDAVTDLSQLAKLRRIQLSLESSDAERNDDVRGQGSFLKTVSVIRRLKDSGFEISVMTTVTRNNHSEIPAMISFLAEEGVDTFAIERFIPEGAGSGKKDNVLSTEEAKLLYETVHRIGISEKRIRVLMYRPLFGLIDQNDCTVGAMCSVGANALTIMHDGTIYPCRRLPIPIGNILGDGLFKPWYDSDVLWSVRETSNLKGKCGTCDLIPICRGCRAMAYWMTGDYLEEDPHCWKQTAMSTI